MKDNICHISKKSIKSGDGALGSAIIPGIFSLIKEDYPDFTALSYISANELNKFQKLFLTNLVKENIAKLGKAEKDVINSFSKSITLFNNHDHKDSKHTSFGQKAADILARAGGSWTFVLCFLLFLGFWMGTNVWLLTTKPFDPYPFILLNLILSCIAAIQAPIIMMSQNRTEAIDREKAEHDYKVNLRAELEIRLLHEKIDHLFQLVYKQSIKKKSSAD